MKKIKGHILSSTIKVLYKKECIERYLSIFSRYFENAGNCITCLNLEGVTNSILCCCGVRMMAPCNSCNGGALPILDKWNFPEEDSIWEHFSLNTFIPKHMNVEVEEFERRLCPNSIIISVSDKTRNRVIAEYCPLKNILLTTDWTNDDSKIEFVKDVLRYLEEVNLIRRRVCEKKKPEIMLGTDPEFELKDPNSNETIDCHDSMIEDRVMMPQGYGRIGRDGAGHQRELRPEPSSTPEGLVANIDKLIVEGLDEKWSLKGNDFTLGGHIHIGGVEVSWDFVELLDYFLSPLTELNGEARKNSRYSKVSGNMDRMREQSHGIEYRVPPSGWLASKELARITLKIVKLLAEKHYSGEDVDITDNLEKDLKLLEVTDEEIKTFFGEIDKFKTEGLPDDLKVAWGHIITSRFTIKFKGSWLNEVKDYIRTDLSKTIVENKLNGDIVLYGVEKENVIVNSSKYLKEITLPTPYSFEKDSHKSRNHIGIPGSIRGNLKEIAQVQPVLNSLVLSILKDKHKIEIVEESPATLFNPLEFESMIYSSNNLHPYHITR